jgi:hypothetical protein
MKHRVLALSASLALAAFSGGPARAGGTTCSDFVTLAANALPPQVGDMAFMQALLSPEVAQPQLPDALRDPKLLKRALKTIGAGKLAPDRSECRFDGKVHRREQGRDPADELECRFRGGKTGESLDLELDRGKVSYLNPMRSYDGASGVENRVSDADAQAMARAAAMAFQCPSDEISPLRLTRLKAAMVPVMDDRPDLQNAQVHVAEVHVLASRHVGGTPVHGSLLRVAIDAEGRVARMHVRWPRFCVVPGLGQDLANTLLSRADVLDAIVETLGEQNACQTLGKLRARIEYVRAGEATGQAEEPDPRDESPGAGEGARCYVPALVLQATPIEPEEDSGGLSMGAPEYIVPLLRGRSDPSRG